MRPAALTESAVDRDLAPHAIKPLLSPGVPQFSGGGFVTYSSGTRVPNSVALAIREK